MGLAPNRPILTIYKTYGMLLCYGKKLYNYGDYFFGGRFYGFLKMKKLAFFGICFAVSALFAEVPEFSGGWASYSGKFDLAGQAVVPPDGKYGCVGGGNSSVSVTVSNRKELLEALNKGSARTIYVKGIIDMTDTGNGSLIPSEVSGSTKELDSLIENMTKKSVLPAKNYSEWKAKYTASFNYDENQSGAVKDLRDKLNGYWKELTVLRLENNTTIEGMGANCGIRGASLTIKGKSNIIIRNLNISDCYNPFPKIEAKDGLNADLDCISIQNSKYIWIDHCTVYSSFSRDKIEKDKYVTKDGQKLKWQVYDGLCDITNTNDFITVSWCIFKNHDKTMLIGNSDKKIEDKNHQTITLHHNIFDSCVQRLPMVRFATIHIYNNVYVNMLSRGIDRRQDCRIYSEGNWFEDKEKSITSNTFGSLYDSGSYNIKTAGLSKKAEWNPGDYYSYKAESAEEAKNLVLKNAGAKN